MMLQENVRGPLKSLKPTEIIQNMLLKEDWKAILHCFYSVTKDHIKAFTIFPGFVVKTFMPSLSSSC